MHGVVVIGTSAGAGEREVAHRLGATGQVFESGNLIAAKLAGAELEPERLLEDARAASEGGGPIVVATSGGLMGPITERFANRDLARELALPLVLAVPASEGLVGAALLTL